MLKGYLFAQFGPFYINDVVNEPLMCEIIPTHLPQPISIPVSSLTPPNHYDL